MNFHTVNGDNMKLINILRYAKGYVKFTVKGGFRERFINLCNAKGILIWNVIPEINRIQACISIKSFHKLRPIVRESGVTLKITEKKGLPLFFKKHRHRAVLMAGIIFIIAFYIIMNRFIWFIEVEGTQTVSHEEIINVLSQYGVKKGAYAPAIDELSAGRSAINHFNGRLLWMSVNIKGSKATVEVRDYIDEHKDTTYGEPCNIVADFDGTLLNIDVINGDIEATPGSAVKKGDLLISGVIQNRDLSASYLEARGKITALHNTEFQRSYPASVRCKGYTDTEAIENLDIIGLEIPYLSATKNTPFSFSEYMMIGKNKLPFGIVYRTKAKEYETEYNSSLLYAVDKYIADFYNIFDNTNILECKMSVRTTDKCFFISSEMSCIDYIGVKSKIYVEK